MTHTLAPTYRPGPPAPEAATDRPWTARPVLAALVAVLVGVLGGAAYLWPQAPSETSVEVGFARDMSQHHAQAVAMAEAIRDRTTDPAIRVLASDVALTQQGQIGSMQAWLAQWGRSATSDGPRMAWMGTPVTGLMPGMAGPAEIAALRTAPVPQAETDFLRMMVAHHTGGVSMASAAAELSDDPEVVQLARGIVASQSSEIDYLQTLLGERGLPPAPTTVGGDAEMPMSAGASGQMGDEGAGADGTPWRDLGLLSTVAAGLLGVAWLVADALRRRTGSAAAPRTSALALAVGAGGFVTGAIHLGLTPEHALESPAYGLFFLLTALVALVATAALWSGWGRPAAAALLALSVGLVLTYVTFRLVAPPGADGPESIDAVGLVTVAAELFVAVAALALLRGDRTGGAVPAPA